MSTKQLLDRWSENNDRLHWVQANRAELEEATGLTIPSRLHELENWLTPQRKGAVTRKLRDAVDGDGDDGETEDADAEAAEADQTADVTEDDNE